MIAQIATVAVYVDDQQQAERFWIERVGFEVRTVHPMGPGARWLEVAPPGAPSCLVLYPRSMVKDWAERTPSIVFECARIADAYQELSSRGVEFVQPPTAMPWGPFAIFRDPDGNEFGLRERTDEGR